MARPTRIKNKLIAQNSVELPQLTPSTAITLDANKNIVSSSVTAAELANVSGTTSPIQGQIDAEKEKIDDHIADSTNPHSVSKDQVGLGNVDNTSDLDKPVSTATQDALNLKYDASNPNNFVDATGAAAAAPVQSVAGKAGDVLLDKSDVGLSNVDNTSDLDKPISTATQTALNSKQDSLGFTPENVANKSIDTNLGSSDTLYPSQKAVKTYVDNSISASTAPDATSSTKGILKLTGDLGGTADSPTVPGLANKANITHTHALSDLTQSSASTGQVVTWNGTNWVPATPDAVITDHTQLSNIGTNTHAQIDSHISAVSDVHGIGPANSVVGTGTSQSLTNKTIDADLNTISNIDNADIKAGAAIDRTKLASGHSYRVVTNNDLGVMTDAAAITPARALISDANGIPTHSTVSSTTLAFLDATSSVQTQLNAKEDVVNKSTNVALGSSDTLYPTQNAVKTYVDNSISSASVPDATTLVKGKLKLAGDLSGTADAPTVPGLALKYDASNPAGYVDATGAAAAAPVQSVAGKVGDVLLDKSDVGLSNVDNTSDLNKPISTATQTALDGKVDESREGQPNGIATLDGTGKVPSSQLPSYVDDVLEFANLASFPAIGETGKIYVALDTNVCYRWSGSAYIQITSGAVASVNGQTGVVVLTKSDIGLGNVDNTSDLDKPISTATQLALDGKADTAHTQALSTITQSGATTGQVPIWNGTAWAPGVPAGTATWGGISGTLSNQTDLQSALDAKFDDPTGTTSQYIRGDGSIADFPTSINQANSLVTTVFNKSGAPIPKFSVVYINGGQGDLPTIALAQANAESSSSKTYGIVYADIPNMQIGQVIVAGALTGVNTDQFNPTAPTGDVNGVALYLSPTVPGGLTTTKPYAPDHMVYVATIVRTHQNEGVVEVRIQNGLELEELHNVQILAGTAQNNQVLKYDSATSLWKNKYIGLASDIEETSFAGANNQSSFANVSGLAFSAASVRSAQVVASVYVNATTPLYQAVEMSIINKGGTFAMSVNGTGDNSGVTFDITNSGQVQYTSSNYTGFVSLTIKFRALTTSI